MITFLRIVLANFPALLLSMAWKRFTTYGAVASMLTGSLSAVLLIFLSPTVQVDLLGHKEAYFPLKNPGLITMPLSFLVGWVVSLLTPEPEAVRRFAAVRHRMHVGTEPEGVLEKVPAPGVSPDARMP